MLSSSPLPQGETHAQQDAAPSPQDPGATRAMNQVRATHASDRTPALVVTDGALWGCGADYKVRFDAAGIEFIPALGKRAPHNLPLTYQLESVGRGADALLLQAPVRSHAGSRVEYARGPLVERYDLREAGVEQSFVFSTLPAGKGDLVVRGALASGLPVRADGDGLVLERDGVGGMRIGGVTGIDARGQTARGTVRHVDGVLELSLPASFVDTAALPLVLDPLIGSVFSAFTFDLEDRNPEVAYDVTNDLFLVVFERIFSSTDSDIHGQRVSSAGALVGTRVYVENTVTNCFGPSVANSNVTNQFVVSWSRSSDIEARGVDAASAALSAVIVVAGGADTQIQADLGGEATLADDDVLCTWWNTTQGRIEAAQIGFNPDNSLFAWDTTTVYESGTVPPSNPRISKGGGTTGNHMIVFQVDYTTDNDPAFCIVSRELSLLATRTSLETAFSEQRFPEVDGDGMQWVVAWETEDPAFPTSNDIVCRGVVWNPHATAGQQSSFTSGITSVTADANDDETYPFVVKTGSSALVGWTDADGINFFSTYFKSLDPASCQPCEQTTQYALVGSLPIDIAGTGASTMSGGGDDDRVLLVLETDNTVTPPVRDIQAQLWESADGTTVALGGSCGNSAGTLRTNCARVGNASFALALQGAGSNTPAFAVVSRNAISMRCGPCRMIADPYTGFAQLATTNAAGSASLSLPIPNVASIRGIDFHVQWIVAEPVSPACAVFGADMTQAVRLTIQ
jgi:hypothetical protein